MSCSVLAIVWTASACVSSTVVIDGKTMTVADAAAKTHAEARAAERAGDPATAKTKYKEVIDRFDEAPAAADAVADLAHLLLDEGGCAASKLYWERLVAEHGASPRAAEGRLALERCGGGAAANATVEAKFFQAESPEERRRLAQEAAEQHLAAGDYAQGARWLIKLRGLTEDPGARAPIDARLTAIIDAKVSGTDVRALLEEVRGDEFPTDLLSYKLGRIQYHIRDFANAKETLEAFVAKWPSSPYVAGAKQLLASLSARALVKPDTVGVLLPLSGPFKAYGENVRQAVRLAAGELDAKKEGDAPPPVNFVFRDSQSDAVATAKAVQDFVEVDGAVAIVGALFRVEAEAAAVKAEELGVPLLTVSSSPEITETGPYVFQSGVTNAAQIDALVAYAMEVMGMKSFAILYPRHPYGEVMRDLFWDRVERRKGEIRGIESYASEETTFTDEVKRLVGRDALDLRSDYTRAIKECDAQPDAFRRTRCKKNASSGLRPIVDFDGLFIPDYPRTLALIAPALAFEDIIVETDPNRLKRIEKTLDRKVKPVTLLGASGWNSPVLPEKAERYVENAVFTDGFFLQAEDKPTMDFVAAFKKHFNRAPSLPEALFFDAIGIVRLIVTSKGPATRNDMREALRRVDQYPGVTGTTSFVSGQAAAKNVRVLTIKDGKILEAAPPSEKAPAPGGPAPG